MENLPILLVSISNNILCFNSDFSEMVRGFINKQICSDNKDLIIDLESNKVISSFLKTEYMASVINQSGMVTYMCIKIFRTEVPSSSSTLLLSTVDPPLTFVFFPVIPYKSPLLSLDFLVNFMFILRTSFSNIIGTLNLVRDNQKVSKDFKKILTSSSLDTMRIINDITEFSNIEENKITLADKPFSLETCLAVAFNIIIKQNVYNRNIFIAKNTPVNVIGDNEKLSIILLHLLKNSKKAINGIKAGSISIKLQLIQSDLSEFANFLFEVKDNGVGISFQDKLSLFDKSNVAKLQFGLSICNGLTTLMHGKIWCKQSETELGSIFCFNVHLKLQ